LFLFLAGVSAPKAQESVSLEPAILGSTWAIETVDAARGLLPGKVEFNDSGGVRGYYLDPETGEKRHFLGDVKQTILDGQTVLEIAAVFEWIDGNVIPEGPTIAIIPGFSIHAVDEDGDPTFLRTEPQFRINLRLVLNEAGDQLRGIWYVRDNAALDRTHTHLLTIDEKEYRGAGEIWTRLPHGFQGVTEYTIIQEDNVSYRVQIAGADVPEPNPAANENHIVAAINDLHYDIILGINGVGIDSLATASMTSDVPIHPDDYEVTINGVEGIWQHRFQFSNQAKISLVRKIRDGEFEPANQIYEGEDYFVEFRPYAPVYQRGVKPPRQRIPSILIDLSSVTPSDGGGMEFRAIELRLQAEDDRLYRSGPVRCLPVDATDSGLNCVDGASIIAAKTGWDERLTSTLAMVRPEPDNIWDQALEKADTCWARGDFENNVRGVVIGGRPIHAAMILIRDELIRVTRVAAAIDNKPMDPIARLTHEREVLAGRKEGLADGSTHPVFDIEVTVPPEDVATYHRIQQVVDYASYLDPNGWIWQFFVPANNPPKIPLSDALSGRYSAQLTGRTREAYELISSAQASGEMLAATQRSIDLLVATSDCDLAALSDVTEMAGPEIAEALLPYLFRRGQFEGEAFIIPDRVARDAVRSVRGFSRAVRDEARYIEMRNDAALTMLNAATLGSGTVAAIGTKAAVAAFVMKSPSAISRFMAWNFRWNLGRFSTTLFGEVVSVRSVAMLVPELTDIGASMISLNEAMGADWQQVELARGLIPVIGPRAFQRLNAKRQAKFLDVAINLGVTAVGHGLEKIVEVRQFDLESYLQSARGGKSTGAEARRTAAESIKDAIISSRRVDEPVPTRIAEISPNTRNSAPASEAGTRATGSQGGSGEDIASAGSSSASPTANDTVPIAPAADADTVPITSSSGDETVPINSGTNDDTVAINAAANDDTVPIGQSSGDDTVPIGQSGGDDTVPITSSSGDETVPVNSGTNDDTFAINTAANDDTVPIGQSSSDDTVPIAPTADADTVPITSSSGDETVPINSGTNDDTFAINTAANDDTVPIGQSSGDDTVPIAPAADADTVPITSSSGDETVPINSGTNDDTVAINTAANDDTVPIGQSSGDDTVPIGQSGGDDTVPVTAGPDADAPAADVAASNASGDSATPSDAGVDGGSSGAATPPAESNSDTVIRTRGSTSPPPPPEVGPELDLQNAELTAVDDAPFPEDLVGKIDVADNGLALTGDEIEIPGTFASTHFPGDTVRDPDGNTVFEMGERLKSGGNSTIFVDAAEPNGSIVRASRLDSAGADDETGLTNNVISDMVGRDIGTQISREDGYFRLSRRQDDTIVANPNNPDERFLLSREESMLDFVEGQQVTNALERFNAQPGGEADEMQRLTMALAIREMNRRGIVWTDNKLTNFDIVPADTATGYRMIIIDTGGIRPVRGATPENRYSNARDAQRFFDRTPHPDNLRAYYDEHWTSVERMLDRRVYGNRRIPVYSPGNEANFGRHDYHRYFDMSPEEIDSLLQAAGRGGSNLPAVE